MRRSIATLLLLLVFAGSASADGFYLAPPAFPKPPAVPAQRALVVHRDGVERLTVESALDAKSQSFGWILPVPAEPTKVEATTRGALDTLELVTRPRIREAVGTRARSLLLTLLGFTLFLAISRFVLLRTGFSLRGLGYVALIALGFLVVLLVPSLGAMHSARIGAIQSPGVRASKTARVGSYAVTVLEAEGVEALSAWLTANGLSPIPEEGRSLVADYVAKGWRFVAARLEAGGTGLLVPHPLRVEFPATEPVYPMRLTALAGSAVALRLWVLADGRASAAGLETTYCARLDDATSSRYPAHPALAGGVWPGAVLTRLEGRVPPGSMGDDVSIALGPFAAHLPAFYTNEGATQAVLAGAAVLWMLVMLVLLFVPPNRLPLRNPQIRPFFLLGILAAVVVGLVAFVYRQTLPTIETIETPSIGWRAYASPGLVVARLRYEGDEFEGLGPDDARARIDAAFRRWGARNPYLGRPVAWSDSPGDFLLVEDERGLLLRRFDARGAPEDEVLRPAAGR